MREKKLFGESTIYKFNNAAIKQFRDCFIPTLLGLAMTMTLLDHTSTGSV